MPLCWHLIAHPIVLVQDLHGSWLSPRVVPEGWALSLNYGGSAYWEAPEAPVVHNLGWILLLTLVQIVLSFWWIYLISTIDIFWRAFLIWRACH